MKTNRHIIKALYSLALGWIFLWAVFAMQGTDGRIIVRQSVFERTGDSIRVMMSVDLNHVGFQPMSYILLTPVINSGSVSTELPAILINGKRQQKAYERSMKKYTKGDPLHTVIDASDSDREEEHAFTWVVPYEQWMVAAEFHLREDQCDCNVYPLRMSYEILARKLEYIAEVPPEPEPEPESIPEPEPEPVPAYEPQLSVSFVIPETEAVKQRSESGKTFLDFPTGKSVLMPEYKNNAAELERINGMIHTLKTNSDATVTEICIDGYASPDGMYRTNLELSGKRAEALKEYMETTYGFDDQIFTIKGMGPDWKGLDSLLQQSDIPYKDQALKIIRNVDDPDRRRQQLMTVGGGAPYKQMLDKIFPLLRRCDYELKYTVLPFTVEQGKEVFKTHPSNLSLNEMFLIANTYEKGSNEFNELFETAARIFPGNDVANNNAAAAALDRKDITSAKRYLDRVKERNAAFLNNMGVLLFMQDYRMEAERYFSDARGLGNSEAGKNLEEIGKLKVES